MSNKKMTTITLPVQAEEGIINQTYDLHPLWDNIEETPMVYNRVYELLNDKQSKDSINSSKRIRNDQEMEYALLSMASSLPNYGNKEVMFYTRYDQNPDTSISCTFPEGDWLVRFVKRASEVYITATQGDITLYRVYNEPVKNFSFEDNIFPPYWDTNNSNIVSLTGLEAQSGTYCMKINDPGDGVGGHLYSSTIIIPRPNETYGASMWIKGEVIEGLNPVPVYLQLEFFDVYLNSLGKSKTAWTKEWTNDWQQIILTNIAVPANAVSMRIVASTGSADGGCIYFDNFSLFISNQEDNNLLKEYNPDFETVVDIPGWPRTNGDYRKYIEILVDDRSISLNNGNRVMKITDTIPSGIWVYSNPISLKANISYTFSANVWGAGAGLYLSEDRAVLREGVSRTQDGDTQILTYTPDSDKDIYLVITTPGSASAIVYVDNVLFAPTEDYINKSSVEIALSEWKEISAANSTLKSGEGIDSMIPANTTGGGDAIPQATNRSAIALGRYTRATGKESMAINYQNQTNGTNSFAANNHNIVDGVNSTAFGHNNKILATNTDGSVLESGFVAGTENTVFKSNQAVFGAFNEETDDAHKAAFIIGDGSEDAKRSNAFMIISQRDKNDRITRTMALGEVQIDEATLQLAAFDAQNPLFQRHSMGGTDPHMILQLDNNNVGCGYSVVLGRNNTVSGADSVALGVDNTVTGVKSFAVNSMNTVSGNMSAAFGNRNEVNGDASVALGGNNNKVSGANSVVTGHMNIANGDMQVVTGIYNKADENAAFIIGNGTSEDNRSNAFIVQKSGSAVFAGKLTIGAQPIDDMDVATKQYVDGKAEQNGKTSVQIITWEDED